MAWWKVVKLQKSRLQHINQILGLSCWLRWLILNQYHNLVVNKLKCLLQHISTYLRKLLTLSCRFVIRVQFSPRQPRDQANKLQQIILRFSFSGFPRKEQNNVVCICAASLHLLFRICRIRLRASHGPNNTFPNHIEWAGLCVQKIAQKMVKPGASTCCTGRNVYYSLSPPLPGGEIELLYFSSREISRESGLQEEHWLQVQVQLHQGNGKQTRLVFGTDQAWSRKPHSPHSPKHTFQLSPPWPSIWLEKFNELLLKLAHACASGPHPNSLPLASWAGHVHDLVIIAGTVWEIN